MAHTAQELDLVRLYLLASAAPVAPLPPRQVPVDVPGDEPEPRRNPLHQRDLAGTV